MSTTVIADTGFFKGRQDYRHERTLVLPDARKVRLKIRRDSHDFQTTATAEVWTPHGWTLVHAIPGETLASAPSAHLSPARQAEQEQWVTETFQRLLDVTTAILA